MKALLTFDEIFEIASGKRQEPREWRLCDFMAFTIAQCIVNDYRNGTRKADECARDKAKLKKLYDSEQGEIENARRVCKEYADRQVRFGAEQKAIIDGAKGAMSETEIIERLLAMLSCMTGEDVTEKTILNEMKKRK